MTKDEYSALSLNQQDVIFKFFHYKHRAFGTLWRSIIGLGVICFTPIFLNSIRSPEQKDMPFDSLSSMVINYVTSSQGMLLLSGIGATLTIFAIFAGALPLWVTWKEMRNMNLRLADLKGITYDDVLKLYVLPQLNSQRNGKP